MTEHIEWNDRYRDDNLPWDTGRPSSEMQRVFGSTPNSAVSRARIRLWNGNQLCLVGPTGLTEASIRGRFYLHHAAISRPMTSQNSVSPSCHSSSRKQACTMLLHCCAIGQAISQTSRRPCEGWTATDSRHEVACNVVSSPRALPPSTRVKIASRIWGRRPGQTAAI